MTDFEKILNELSSWLQNVTYKNGDLSDIGNEIGILLGKHIKEDTIGFEQSSLISGIKHGISLIDGTHG
jgi:hypothetical protein